MIEWKLPTCVLYLSHLTAPIRLLIYIFLFRTCRTFAVSWTSICCQDFETNKYPCPHFIWHRVSRSFRYRSFLPFFLHHDLPSRGIPCLVIHNFEVGECFPLSGSNNSCFIGSSWSCNWIYSFMGRFDGWNSIETAVTNDSMIQLCFSYSPRGFGRTTLHIPNFAFSGISLRSPTVLGVCERSPCSQMCRSFVHIALKRNFYGLPRRWRSICTDLHALKMVPAFWLPTQFGFMIYSFTAALWSPTVRPSQVQFHILTQDRQGAFPSE